MPGMRIAVGLLLVLLAPLLRGAEAEERGQTQDLTLRYVNDSIISLGDVRMRSLMRLGKGEYDRLGRPAPRTLKEFVVFMQESLELLTDEELLIQYARKFAEERSLQIIDPERISQQVMEEAKRVGRGMTLRDQAKARRDRERNEYISFAMSLFMGRTPHIAPLDIERSYKERDAEFRRPARAKVYQIVMNASGAVERQEIRQARIAVFKAAQDCPDAAVRAASESRIEAYTIANAEQQERLLTEAVQEIAKQAERADLAGDALALARRAVEVEKQAAAQRDVDGAKRDLEKLRAELVGKDIAAFAEAAKKFSQGLGSGDGGLLGWVDPGRNAPAFDAAIFSIKPGELSEVFVVDRSAYLVLVADRNEATQRPFGEVVGEIESALQRSQDEAVRAEAVRMLRSKALVRDVATIAQSIK